MSPRWHKRDLPGGGQMAYVDAGWHLTVLRQDTSARDWTWTVARLRRGEWRVLSSGVEGQMRAAKATAEASLDVLRGNP